MIRSDAPLPPGTEVGDIEVLSIPRGYDPQVIPRTHALVDAWVISLAARRNATESHLAVASCSAFRRGIRPWLRYLVEEAHTDEPTTATVEAFVAWVGRTHRASTVALYLAAVRGLYRWAAARGDSPDIAADVHPSGGATADPPLPTLTDAEYRQLFQSVAGDDLRARRDRALIACLHGVPVDTIGWARALVRALDLDHLVVRLVPRGRLSAWHRGVEETATQEFPLTTEAGVYLGEYLRARGRLQPSDPLFASTRDGRALSTLSMRLTVLRCLEACGLRTPSAGLARNKLLYRYPVVTRDDLVDLEARLPTEPQEAARARALVHLLAIPKGRANWDRLTWGAVDLVHKSLRVPRGSRTGPRLGELALSPAAAAALARWRALVDPSGDTPLFPGPDGSPLSHHTLKRIAWGVFPERVPTGGVPQVGSSSRRLKKAG